jgi:hypothetical protein
MQPSDLHPQPPVQGVHQHFPLHVVAECEALCARTSSDRLIVYWGLASCLKHASVCEQVPTVVTYISLPAESKWSPLDPLHHPKLTREQLPLRSCNGPADRHMSSHTRTQMLETTCLQHHHGKYSSNHNLKLTATSESNPARTLAFLSIAFASLCSHVMRSFSTRRRSRATSGVSRRRQLLCNSQRHA